MSSVWIILGSQTQVLFRLHLPLLLVSMLHPLLTFWRAACLYIRSNTPEFWIQKTYQPSCPSHAHVCEDALAKYVWMFMLNCVRFYFDSIDLDNEKTWRFLSLTPGTESTGTLIKNPKWSSLDILTCLFITLCNVHGVRSRHCNFRLKHNCGSQPRNFTCCEIELWRYKHSK